MKTLSQYIREAKKEHKKIKNEDRKNYDFPVDFEQFVVTVFHPDSTTADATCNGDIPFLKGKMWKLGVMMGFSTFPQGSFQYNTSNSKVSISRFDKNMEEDIKLFHKWLDERGIEYGPSTQSQNGWQRYINIRQNKSNIDKVNKLYDEFYASVK